MDKKFEVFAISEEGTQTVLFANTEEEAKRETIRLIRELSDGIISVDTDLSRIIGFDYDQGPEEIYGKKL